MVADCDALDGRAVVALVEVEKREVKVLEGHVFFLPGVVLPQFQGYLRVRLDVDAAVPSLEAYLLHRLGLEICRVVADIEVELKLFAVIPAAIHPALVHEAGGRVSVGAQSAQVRVRLLKQAEVREVAAVHAVLLRLDSFQRACGLGSPHDAGPVGAEERQHNRPRLRGDGDQGEPQCNKAGSRHRNAAPAPRGNRGRGQQRPAGGALGALRGCEHGLLLLSVKGHGGLGALVGR
mmetsp:Transcript_390/g.1183  ORF Transcript_390/g.1183 Transcript_390/m.1183 type:complete len:235 (-) Transcript_390:69-773(-)